ncbi:MAG: hypothetical protein JW904_01340 [Spirochaetales bacterium]|nr:hypothetical protein [Spirochaetales bacterium]
MKLEKLYIGCIYVLALVLAAAAKSISPEEAFKRKIVTGEKAVAELFPDGRIVRAGEKTAGHVVHLGAER